jgi:elongation factor P--(R)-beta-lysine ligase
MSGTPRDGSDWAPTASLERLRLRAALLARAREFFARRGVLEVDTPILVEAAVTDVHIHSARVQLEPGARPLHLHTSPEYAMKRLLAAGSGDIYQIVHVVRSGERSRLHNPEFTLIEWYRVGLTLEALMSEVDALARELLGPLATTRATERITYREAFVRELGLDPLEADIAVLERAAAECGYVAGGSAGARRDELLDAIVALRIGPRLGRDALTFVHGYPASQAALAELDAEDPRTALRFELYADGIELANGFRELASASEQRSRFERDAEERRRRGDPAPPPDERLLAALEAGLPACSGVAVGFDRLLMIAAGAQHIAEVLPFPTERA